MQLAKASKLHAPDARCLIFRICMQRMQNDINSKSHAPHASWSTFDFQNDGDRKPKMLVNCQHFLLCLRHQNKIWREIAEKSARNQREIWRGLQRDKLAVRWMKLEPKVKRLGLDIVRMNAARRARCDTISVNCAMVWLPSIHTVSVPMQNGHLTGDMQLWNETKVSEYAVRCRVGPLRCDWVWLKFVGRSAKTVQADVL